MDINNYQDALEYISNMPKVEQIKYINKQVRLANQQIRRVEKSGLYSKSLERTKALLKDDRFHALKKNATDTQIKRQLADVINYRKSPTYSIKAIREELATIKSELEEKDIFQFDSQQDFNDFYKLIHSKEYDRATSNRARFDSTIAMDEMKEALLDGASIDDIKSALQQFATSEITADQFQDLINDKGVFDV